MSLKYWAGLSLIPGVGSIRVKKLLEHYKTPERVWRLSKEELLTIPTFGVRLVEELIKVREETDLDRFLQHCKEAEICLVCPEDSEFPANLKHIYDPPPVIYYRGSLKSEDLHSIAIVGSRKMTTYGKRAARMLSSELVQKGFTIISGLALGIDSAAHEAALESGGRTIAVLGSGVDVIYPREHKKLYEAIIKSGAVISTYPPDTQPKKGHFPARNRIISGLAYGTVVVEAGERSGALITADLALEQNREVFAVPGSIFSPMSAGTNALIQKGAKLINSVQDILDEFERILSIEVEPKVKSGEKSQFTDIQRRIVALLAGGELGMDELLLELDLSMSELNSTLLELEIMGVITQEPGLKFALL